MNPVAAGWTSTKRFVDSQAFAVGSGLTFKLPKIVAAGISIFFSGTSVYNTMSGTAQPRATARLLGLITIMGTRKGNHKGINCAGVPAHMLQLRQQVLSGSPCQETALTTTQGAFSLSLPILFYDPRLSDKSEQVAQMLDLTQYGDVTLQIQTGQIVAASGDDDRTSIVGSATSATLTTPRVNVSMIEANLAPGAGYFDPDFEYFFDVQTAAAQMKGYTLSGSGIQAYDVIEGVKRGATAIETLTNIIPDDGNSKLHTRLDNKPMYEDFGPNVQGDTVEMFTNLSATPTGLYVIDRCHRSLRGPIDFSNLKGTQYLDIDNASASSLSATDVKVRVLHLTYNK